MPVPHQVADEPPVLRDPLGALAVRHARGLDDGLVGAHVINHPDEPVIQNLERKPELVLELGDDGSRYFLWLAVHLVTTPLLKASRQAPAPPPWQAGAARHRPPAAAGLPSARGYHNGPG